jgi:hypothetical protein
MRQLTHLINCVLAAPPQEKPGLFVVSVKQKIIVTALGLGESPRPTWNFLEKDFSELQNLGKS